MLYGTDTGIEVISTHNESTESEESLGNSGIVQAETIPLLPDLTTLHMVLCSTIKRLSKEHIIDAKDHIDICSDTSITVTRHSINDPQMVRGK